MTVFFTADQHFKNKGIIGHNRPFQSVEEMDAAMIERWNAVVRPGDEVYHLGDLTFGTAKYALELLPRLRGHINLIPGNHDSWWTQASHAKQAELAQLVDILPLLGTYRFDGLPLVLSHYPLKEWEDSPHGVTHLHGHTHLTTPR